MYGFIRLMKFEQSLFELTLELNFDIDSLEFGFLYLVKIECLAKSSMSFLVPFLDFLDNE